MPLVGLHLAGLAGWHPSRIGGLPLSWLQLLLATPVVLWCGWPLLERGARSIVNRSPNMFTLIGLGVVVSYVFSVLATLAPGLVPKAFHSGTHPALYFESAAMIVTLVLLGQVLELRARQRTGAALRALLDLAPKEALRLQDDGSEASVPLVEVRPGDRLRVRPGEKVPVDGVVLEGRGAVDESMVTGESLPIAKEPGAAVIGGTLNGTAAFVMRAERVGADTLLARIVQTVAEAQRSRAPVQGLADRVAAWFVPAVVAIALLAAVVWWLVGPEPRLAYALVVAVSTLVIACPCALGLATPMSMTVAMGRGAQAGVLFRSAEALERLRDVDTLVLDKTGTLTVGRPEVVTVIPVDGIAEAELLRFAASLEQSSEHPLAAAVVAAAQARGLRLGRSYGFRAVPGKGALGVVQLRNVAVGNAALMTEAGVDVQSLEREARAAASGRADRGLRRHRRRAARAARCRGSAQARSLGRGAAIEGRGRAAGDPVRGPRRVGAGGGGATRHRRRRGRRAARRQGRTGAGTARRRPGGRDGGRRHQRCAGAGGGRRRHRHGRRHRHRQAGGRRDAGERRPAWLAARTPVERGHDGATWPRTCGLRSATTPSACRSLPASCTRWPGCCSRRRSRRRPCR